MANYEKWSYKRLKESLGKISKVVSDREVRMSDLPGGEFERVHSTGECQVTLEFQRIKGSGFVYVGFSAIDDYESPVYVYKLRCAGHEISS